MKAIPIDTMSIVNPARLDKYKINKLGYDDAWIDDYGNVIGRVGRSGAGKQILCDGHIDTVGIGNPDQWRFHPLTGEVAEDHLWGRGAADNKNANAVQVYGAFISKKVWGDSIPVTVYVIGSIMEEDCDGLAVELAIRESIKDKIDAVILGGSPAAISLLGSLPSFP